MENMIRLLAFVLAAAPPPWSNSRPSTRRQKTMSIVSPATGLFLSSVVDNLLLLLPKRGSPDAPDIRSQG
jgi:hypothetical protein